MNRNRNNVNGFHSLNNLTARTDKEAEELARKTYYYPYENEKDWLNRKRQVLIQVYKEESQKSTLKLPLSECLTEFDKLFSKTGKIGEFWDKIKK